MGYTEGNGYTCCIWVYKQQPIHQLLLPCCFPILLLLLLLLLDIGCFRDVRPVCCSNHPCVWMRTTHKQMPYTPHQLQRMALRQTAGDY